MADSTGRLASGQRWSDQQFLDHYFEPTASGTPTPVAGRPLPVNVDMSWYIERSGAWEILSSGILS
jgi:hypothetical protein